MIVPVRQLKSGKKRMDEVMHAAMNEPQHKLIKFTITGLEVKSVKDGCPPAEVPVPSRSTAKSSP